MLPGVCPGCRHDPQIEHAIPIGDRCQRSWRGDPGQIGLAGVARRIGGGGEDRIRRAGVVLVQVGQDHMSDSIPTDAEGGEDIRDGGVAAGCAGVDDGGFAGTQEDVGRHEPKVDPFPDAGLAAAIRRRRRRRRCRCARRGGVLARSRCGTGRRRGRRAAARARRRAAGDADDGEGDRPVPRSDQERAPGACPTRELHAVMVRPRASGGSRGPPLGRANRHVVLPAQPACSPSMSRRPCRGRRHARRVVARRPACPFARTAGRAAGRGAVARPDIAGTLQIGSGGCGRVTDARTMRPPRAATYGARPRSASAGHRFGDWDAWARDVHWDGGTRHGDGHVRPRQQDLRRFPRREGSQPRDRGRRIHGPGRTIRLRQDDQPADDRRTRGDLQRRVADRRSRRQRRPAQGSRHRDGLPELRALSAHVGA